MPDFGRWTSNGGDPSLNDINRVDRFFDALGSKQTAYSTDHAEAELAFLLADWRDDVRDAPVTAPVTPRDAAAALRGGLNTRKRSRTSLALVSSVAAAVLCLGGFGVAVFGSSPGDAFYGIRTTLFGQEQQVRDEQVTLASQQLQQVQQLIDQGQWEQAQDKLAELSTTVQSVEAPPEQKQDLIQQWNALTYKVVEQDPAATLPPPGEPMPVLPDSPLTLLPVPVIETSTSSSTTTSTTTTSTSTSAEAPGPEIVLTSPTTATETSDPSSPSSSPTTTTTTTAPTTTTTSAPTSTTTTTTTTTRAPEVTSVPQTAAAPPPSTATQAPVPASSSVALAPAPPAPPAAPAAPAPPAGGSTSSGPAVAPSQPAPSQSEPTTVTQNAPKKPSEDEQPVVTTTVAPPH